MKHKQFLKLAIAFSFAFLASANVVMAQARDLRIVLIRHAEKPEQGDNLTCQGVQRALKLPAVIYAKFGVPAFTFVPSIGVGEATKHSRMFQTVMPLAAKYNLTINSVHPEKDAAAIATDLKSRSGTVLMVCSHKGMAAIVTALGVTGADLLWPDDDYDTIWVITFANGKAVFAKDKENIKPAKNCNF